MGPKFAITTPFENLPDVKLISAEGWDDERGMFCEMYRENELCEALGCGPFVQGNVSVSHSWVFRGLHYQVRKPQGKLMRTVGGATCNVVRDMREGSATFGESNDIELPSPRHALWVPPGYANGFLAFIDNTVVVYECTSYHETGWDRAVQCHEVAFSGLATTMSHKDLNAPLFVDAEKVPEAEWRV